MVQKTNVGFNYSTKEYYGRVYSFILEETEGEILIKKINIPSAKVKEEGQTDFEANETVSTDDMEESEAQDKPFITYLKLIEDIQNNISLFPDVMQKGKPIFFEAEGQRTPVLGKKPSKVLTGLMNSASDLETLEYPENRLKSESAGAFEYSIKGSTNYIFELIEDEGMEIIIKKMKIIKNIKPGNIETAEDLESITLLTLIEDLKDQKNLPKELQGQKDVYMLIEGQQIPIKGKNSEIMKNIIEVQEVFHSIDQLTKKIEENQQQGSILEKKIEKQKQKLAKIMERINEKEQDEETK